MNILSLFDGMACGRIALERAGISVTNYFASEIDKHAIKVAKHNWPDIIHIGDVTKVTAKDLPKIDLLIGGSPCQGFSFAGKQLNFDDPRSKLFFEFVRILKEIREVNPNVKFMLENVVMKKEYQDVISKYLGVNPVLINSELVSAQSRKRLYWTNISEIKQPEDKGIVLNKILEPEASGKYIIKEKALERGLRKTYSKMKFNPEKTGTLNTKKNSGQMSIDSGTTLIQVGLADNIKGFEAKRRVYHPSGKAPTLLTHTGGQHHAKICIDDELWRRLTPIECERLQTVPDGYTNICSDSARYKMLGNGWTVDVIAHIFKHL